MFAAIPITTDPYSQNFDTLAITGTTNTLLPDGWELAETGTNANSSYRADTGAGNTGDTYSYGASGVSERAFGALQSGSLIPVIGASFQNAATFPFTALQIAYTGEQWRVGQASRPDRLDFQYSLDASSLTTGTWTDVDALDFNSIQNATVGAKDGNATGFRTAIAAAIPATVPVGSTVYVRWVDFNATGTDDGMAIDDFTITASSKATLSIATESASSSKAEGDSSSTAFTFNVVRTGPSNDEVRVDWSVVGAGTYAAQGSDFQGAISGTLTFPPGTTSLPITVNVVGDTTIEPDEQFAVALTNAVNVTNAVAGVSIGNPSDIATIVNDDLQALAPGDIVITGINTTNPDQFSFVPLVDLAPNLPIKFTDNGWDASLTTPALATSEGTVMYVTPSTGLPKGTKVIIEILGSATVMRTGPGSSIVTGSLGLNSTGENMFAYQGDSRAPQFLFAVNTNVSYLSPGSGAIQNSTTYLPPSLTVGSSAVEALGLATGSAVANAEYKHATVVGTKTELLAATSNASQWNTSAAAIGLNTTNFTIGVFNQVGIQAESVVAAEGTGTNSAFAFTVTRTGDGTTAQTVDFTVTGQGASASDFVGNALPSGTISFPADGTLTRTVVINVLGDSLIELDETFVVALSNPSTGLAIGNANTTGTILNDDIPDLQPGDVLITGINASNPDQFSFVPLVNVPENSQITFTDNGWDGSSLSNTEGSVTYVAPSGGLSQGTKVVVNVSGTPTVIVGPGSAVLSGNFALNTSGENLFAYVGSNTSPRFLSAVNTNVSYLTTGAISASTTYLPNSLVIGQSAVAPLGVAAAVANAEYDHSKGLTGSQSALQALVENNANWLSSGNAISLNSNNFSVSNGASNGAPTGLSLSPTTIAENAGANATVGDFTTTDPDAGNTFTYSLVTGTGSTDNATFSINGSTLRATTSFDFETKSSYSVRVRTTDQGGLFFENTFVITVANVNEAPVFNPASYTFSLAENSATGTAVGSVSATDVDAGTTLTYSLSGSGASNFTINPSTGAITVAAGAVLDFEGTKTWSLVATASDGSLSATAPVTINLTNVNEAPVFNPASYTFSLAENSATGAAVGSVSATDVDAGTTLTYSLSGTGSGNFSINPSTGAITVAAGAVLNFEGTSTWNLTATASDGTLSTTAPVTINLTNVNETPVFNPASYTFSVAENSAVGTAVGSVTATDPDAGSTLTYSLTGVDASKFVINPTTGAITVAAGADLNFEGTNSFSFSASVSDGSLSATAAVTINVINVNEAPVFAPPSYTFSLAENSAAGTAVGTVSATDVEGTALTYSLSGSGASNFTINPSTGAIAVAVGASLNASTTPTYNLIVTASDGSLAATAPVTVNITAARVAASLTSVAVNGGDTFKNASQRSEITSLVVTFSAPVTLSAGAFSIVNTGLETAQTPVALAQSQILITANAANTQFTIRFGAGPGVVTRGPDGLGRGNSLVDGNYVLSIDPTKVFDGVANLSPTNNLGDGDNEFGDLATDEFFRMFGDSNGDGVISTSDTAAFRASLTNYDSAFDWDGNGSIASTGADRDNFLSNFGKRRLR